ncbi:ATP-binding protein [Candidatus Margulisiibacteriota bacterium]
MTIKPESILAEFPEFHLGNGYSKRSVFALINGLIALAFVLISPLAFSMPHWLSSSDFHSCLELTGSFIAIFAGIVCLMYFFGLKSRFYLIIGIGFLAVGAADFFHGLISWDRAFFGTGIDLLRFMPGTYTAGKVVLALVLIAAPMLEYIIQQTANEKKEMYFSISISLLLAAGVTIMALLIPLPQFIFPAKLISRPLDLLTALLFGLAFILILKRYIIKKDLFSGLLLASVLLNLGGQIYMSFSKHLFDIYFDIAHWANFFSYFMPIMGISIQGLGEIKKTTTELAFRKRVEEALREGEEELRYTLQELKRSNAELEQFAYVASHDLQEPLRMISSYVQLLEKKHKDKFDDDTKTFINYAVEGAKRMQQLIKDLLEYSRVSTQGKEYKVVDCMEIMEHVVDNMKLAIKESKAEITYEALPLVKGDTHQLLQLFQNLVGNALKFKGEDAPKIKVSSRAQRTHWLIAVSDNGLGIDPQMSERIFEVFQRLHSKDDYPGTGIGLAICKKIVEHHGGSMWVEPNTDQGSVFYFTIAKNASEHREQMKPEY